MAVNSRKDTLLFREVEMAILKVLADAGVEHAQVRFTAHRALSAINSGYEANYVVEITAAPDGYLRVNSRIAEIESDLQEMKEFLGITAEHSGEGN